MAGRAPRRVPRLLGPWVWWGGTFTSSLIGWLGVNVHALGARQLDWVDSVLAAVVEIVDHSIRNAFQTFLSVGAFGPHRWASTLWRASVRPVYPAVPLVHSFRGQSGGANPSLVWWAAPFLFDVLV